MLRSLSATTDGTGPEATRDSRIRSPSGPRPLNHRVWRTRITANRPLIRARHRAQTPTNPPPQQPISPNHRSQPDDRAPRKSRLSGLGGALEGGEVLRRQHELRRSRSPRPLSERLISLTYERPARRTEQSLTPLCQVAVASVDAVRRRLYEPGAPIVGQAGNLCGALDVAPADRQIGDEAKDDDRQRQRDRSGV